MKSLIAFWVSFVTLLTLFPNTSFSSHTITYFRDNKKGAVSLNFDDGYPYQITDIVPFLNARNLKGTFFAITGPGWINSHVSWETWRDLVRQGHEIGSHTVNHPDLTTLTDLNMKWEISESQKMINENIPSQPTSPKEVFFAVNCGGQKYTDQVGIVYQADTFFAGGRTKVTRASIEETEDDVLYQSERYGNFSYSIPISNGSYMVTLKFAETFYNATGKRIFDVKIEGMEVITNLDLFAQVGKNKAYDITIPISVTDDALNIDFIPNVGNAAVGAIIVATPSKSCVLFAYPYANSNIKVQNAASDYYIAARGTWTPEGEFLNYYEDGPTWKAVNFFNIASYYINENTTMADLDNYLNLAEQRNAWFSVHSYDEATTNFIIQFIDHLLTKNVWVDTFGSIVRYMQERLFSTLVVISESSSEIKLSLSHSLDNSIYDLPLTIRSSVPSPWKEVIVKQGNSITIVTSVIENNETVIYYNATPNSGEIVLKENPIFAVNCGGQEYTDQVGIIYQADTLYTGGKTRVTKTAIEATEDDVLYQSERYGTFSYSIPISNGNYMVTLKFAETSYFYNGIGKRIFDVKIEGMEVITNLDLFAQVGKNKAYDITIPVSVTDAILNIDFITNAGNATLSAIMITN